MITEDPNYKEKFSKVQAHYEGQGYIVLNPAILPAGLKNADYMQICLAMLGCADAVVMLPDWNDSPGAKLERASALYSGKVIIYLERCSIK